MKIISDLGEVPKHAPLYIYGAGGAGRALLHRLIQRPEFTVLGVIDSHAIGALSDKPILSPDAFIATKPRTAIILIASQYHDEIANTLNRIGFKNYINAFPLAELLLMQQSTDFIDFTDSDQVTSFYNQRYSGSYMDKWDEDRKRILAELFGCMNIQDGFRIVDFGCGSGVLTRLIQDLFPRCDVWGVDISETAVAKASKEHPGITFKTFGQISSAEQESLVGSFDILFSHHVIEHVYDLSETVKNMDRLVKIGGVMLHLLPCGNPGSLEHRICTWYRKGIDSNRAGRFFYEDQGHLRRLKPDDLTLLFTPFGYILNQALFTNQFWGAINWISDSPTVFIRSLCNGGADDALHPRQLRLLRRIFLTLRWCRRPPDGFPTDTLSGLRRATDKLIRWLAAREWRRCAQKQNGSEMILFFSKNKNTVE